MKINTSRDKELKGGDDATEELVARNTTQELRTNDKRTEKLKAAEDTAGK